MADKNNHDERLEVVMNQLAESVLAQSNEAILAETSEAGVDTQGEAEQTRFVLRQAAKLFNDVNTRLSSLGHIINSNDWRRGQRGYHTTCISCGSFVSFTTTTGEMRGDALDGKCLESEQYAIRRREGLR
jgi:hypothetical protein